ncbi:MAG TPA: hypothetical protein VFZ09_01170 [Archangium sp.]|uniref:hypothetical protein n=1 Tax=Archangium sp. TaxID=1872627 RepID=UPI002E33C0D6|nr:hypothetical protein [Archangium sp.]HEX5744819.1 hypothetical protein [Archangium sp.]
MKSQKSIIIAIIAGLCGLAGTLANVLPDGQLQKGAEKVANVCEAGGFRAYPETEVPPPGDDGGTAPSPTLPPVLELPPPPGQQRAQVAPSPSTWRGVERSWTWLPASERWPGESRGWHGGATA